VVTTKLLVRLLTCLALTVSPHLYAGESIRIASQNMNRFYDNIDNGRNELVFSKTEFDRKVGIASAKIINQYQLPDIIALQEIENRNVLSNIARVVNERSGIRYQVVLIEGNDFSAINLAYLVKQTLTIKSANQLFKTERLRLDQSLLFSRPPLYLEACIKENCLSLLNLHLRSMRGIGSSKKSKRVRLKRLEQASKIARWINNYQQTSPTNTLLILGDLNGLTPSDDYVDIVGTILGHPDNSNTEHQAADLIRKDMVDLTRIIPAAKRYSYIYRKKKQILDYMLINSESRLKLQSIAFGQIDYDFSDHAALVAHFSW
jgi:predicted extracellular nuclease